LQLGNQHRQGQRKLVHLSDNDFVTGPCLTQQVTIGGLEKGRA
jgi:hypothetical protein